MTNLLFYFQLGCLLFPLLVWLLRVGPPVLCWIREVKADIPVIFPMLWQMLVVVAHWVWCWQWVSHRWPLLCLGMFPLFLLCWVFIISGCWILLNAFSASIDMIMWFLSFILFMWWITFIDLWMLYQPCIPRINPTWSWCMTLLMHCCIQFANILLRILVSEFIRDIACHSFWVRGGHVSWTSAWWVLKLAHRSSWEPIAKFLENYYTQHY